MKKTPILNSSILFFALLLGLSYLYGYHEITFKKPQSVHKWRQSDCASIALNYYQGGMHFLKPEVHNLTSEKGTSGKCCTSEVPILYYSVALLYKLFGYHDWIFRMLNTLIFFTGLFFLFKLLLYLLKDVFWAVGLSLLFFTSPVLVYYGNNFLSNSSAFSFSLIGWYFFIRFLFESRNKWFYFSMLCFFLAAAFKVTALFSLIAIFGICILEMLGLKFNNDSPEKIFKQPKQQIIPMLVIFTIIGAWLKYAHDYNSKYDCTYFSTTIFPIWDLSKEEIHGVLNNVREVWLNQYFHVSALLFIAACFLFTVFNFRKKIRFFFVSILFVLAGAIAYVILQFWTFADHDYYTIDLYILLVLIVISTFDVLKRYHLKVFNSIYLKALFLLFLIFNVYHAKSKITERYDGWMNDYPKDKDIYAVTSYLRQIGVTANDTVISIPDASNASLYLMNQKGWTEYTDARFNIGKPITYNEDSAGIQSSIDKGAKYLIVNGIEELYKKKYLQNFCTDLAGNYNNVYIFRLRNRKNNFSLDKRKIKERMCCNAELVSKDKQSFVNDSICTIFQNGETQNAEFAHSGEYSSKLNSSSNFGMTIKIKDVKYGESFSVSVWRKTSAPAKGAIIASSGSYYNSESTVLEADSIGWEKISKEFFISNELVNQELVIYLFNPEVSPVFFDDLEIVRYESFVNNK